MFIKSKYVTLVLAMVVALSWAGAATAEFIFKDKSFGRLRVNGFVRLQADIRTGEKNPNNFPPIESNIQQVKQWGVVDLDWESPIKGLKAFVRGRYQWDLTDSINDGNFDAFPGSGDNVDITRTGGKDAIAELWEARLDYSMGDWWFRIGRQNIVWGDLAPTRLLDTVNSLDLSFHLFNELGGREAFDNIRIPIWALRASYSFPKAPGYSIEAFVSPNKFGFIPTQLSAVGAPFNTVGLPPFITLTDDAEGAESGVSAGVRLLGVAGPVSYTLNWIVRRDGDGVGEVASQGLDPSRFVMVAPGVFAPIGSPLPFGALPGDFLALRNVHETFHSVGVSGSYFHPASKVVVRVEAVYDIDRPFELRTLSPPGFDGSPPFFTLNSGTHVEDDQFGYAIALDRPTFLFRKDRAAAITLQIEQRFRGNPDAGTQRGLLGARADETETKLTFLFSQAWKGFGGRYDEWFTDLAAFYDFGEGDSSFIQPSVRYEPGNHWRYAVWYTGFNGSDRRAGKFGSLRFASGVNLSVTYQF